MIILRSIALAAMLVLGLFDIAHSQQHWLVGTWKGELGGLPPSTKYGAERTLIVEAVDGNTAKATWIGPALTQTVSLTITGDGVVFATPGNGGSTYTMSRKGDTMSGAWAASGSSKSGPISLKKQ